MFIIIIPINRILKSFASLKSYFLSEDWADKLFKRLQRFFQNPLLEPALSLQANAITLFTYSTCRGMSHQSIY